MKKTQGRYSALNRVLALLLAFVMVAGYFPTTSGWKVSAAELAPGTITTVADPETLTRPTDIYGQNTLNAGKVTVGKSVSTTSVTVNGQNISLSDPDNFLVTISQSAQVMGLSSETSVPVDVVFVLDTSGSMGYNNTSSKTGRAEAMVNAANNAIATLLAANEHNRVSVVAFSGEDAGGGDSDGDAANVLSSLYHYEGNAASKHLQWVNGSKTAYNGSTTNTTSTNFGVGSNYYLIAGRDTDGTVGDTRNGGNGGTNIHAGIALGAQQLTRVTDTTVTYEDGTTVTRMPFIVLLSDGAPTFSSSSENWYAPSQTAEQGPGSSSYAGNGFLAALTAAYYKGVITEHYYGDKADNDNSCNIYTIGVMLNSLTEDNGDRDLAEVTMNPKQYLSDTTNTFADDFNSYWTAFGKGGDFLVQIQDGSIGYDYNGSMDDLVWIGEGEPGSGAPDPDDYWAYRRWRNANYLRKSAFYTVTENTISATSNYVNGKNKNGQAMYTGGIAYNDGHYNATQTSEIAAIFQNIVNEISKKAISAPTHVNTTSGENFSGYVHFSDPIGQYMEVKDLKGVVVGDKRYQGASFAEMLKNYGKGGAAQDKFDALLRTVLDERMKLSGSTMDEATFIQNALKLDNQAYYNSATDFDNSIVWWGSEYVSGNGEQLQVLGNAENDTVAFIESVKAHDADPNNADNKIIPAGAKYVCRSYFFYGTTEENHEFMHFMLRVQRSLEAPYQQTVVISCPASLLSVEEVLITEESDGTHSATVETASPTRVVYEVGLRSDINAQNVDQIVDSKYKTVAVEGTGSVNYSNGTYNFFTNDWDRSKNGSNHHRAMTEATFEAAADNSFYAYQQDTQILVKNGDGTYSAYTGTNAPNGTYYYAREYYDWTDASLTNGKYKATLETSYIQVVIDDASTVTQKNGGWYIKKGVYTASTLQTIGDDIIKDDPETAAEDDGNKTGTALIVSHAHRTNTATDNHYTVKLGNNGMLTIVSDPPKSVDVTHNGTTLEDQNGKTVMVGDTLTYKIKVVNNEGAAATAVVTDKIPTGTKLVAGSISDGGQNNDGTITWNLNLAKGETKTVSFQVEVLPDALAGEQNVQNITNTGTIKIGNNPAYTTNTTTNPPEGKKVVVDEDESLDGIQVGDTLTYRIRFYNDTGAEADKITVTDSIPSGTTYVANSADHNGQYSETDNKITWEFTKVPAGYSGVVSFDVKVDASVKQSANATQPGEGEITITNNATIQIGTNGPTQTTNTTENKVKTGSVAVTKVVTNTDKQSQGFKVQLSESTGKLNGTYLLSGSTAVQSVTFTNGVSNVLDIAHNQTLTVHGLPAGTTIYVQEMELGSMPGWSAVYTDNDGGKDPQRVVVIADDPQTAAEEIRQFTITNTYRTTPVTFQLKGSKAFTGANFPAGRFTFKAQLADENGNVKTGNDALSITAVIDHTGGEGSNVSFAFSPREFTKVETRYYLIDESTVSIPGVTTSTKQYLLKLEITDVNAQLVVNASIKSRDDSATAWNSISWSDFNWANTTVDFTNTYKPAETSLTLSGTKTLSGRVMSDNEFGFELVEEFTDPTDESKKTYTTISTALVKANTSDAHDGTFSFDPITYKAEGTHTYIIREIKGNNDRITYDDDFYKVTVEVSDVGGQLVATVTAITKYNGPSDSTGTAQTSSNTFAYAFANTFTPADVSVTLSGNKILTGEAADGLTAGEFTFTVQEADATGAVKDYNGDHVIEEYAGSNVAQSTEVDDKFTAAINFANIQFNVADMSIDGTTAGTVKTVYYYYVISEKIPAADAPGFDVNMGYDGTKYLAKIKLTYDSNSGALTAALESMNVLNGAAATAANFTNYQNPSSITYTPVGSKTTTGGSLPGGLTFSFRVLEVGVSDGTTINWYEEAQKHVEGTGVSSANGDITFTELVYNAADAGKIYYYLVEENTGLANDGITYAVQKYVLKVSVNRNAQTNALERTAAYYAFNTNFETTVAGAALTDTNSNGFADEIAFTNTYAAEKFLSITAKKEQNGGTLKEDTFDFRLQLLNRTLVDGVFQYSLGNGVVNGANNGAVQSDNTNQVNFGTLYFTTAGQMTTAFKLGDNVIEDKVDTTINGNDGFYYVKEIYQYDVLMSEIKPASAAIPGMLYDSNQYIVSIQWVRTYKYQSDKTTLESTTLSDPKIVSTYLASEANGIYTTTGENKYNSGNDTGVTFTNTYKPTKGDSVVIEASKVLTGRDLRAGEFTFNLYYLGYNDANLIGKTDVTGITPFAASNGYDADGNGTITGNEINMIRFLRNYPATMSLSYFNTEHKAVFYYLLEEANGVLGGVTYSGAKYYVAVEVTHEEASAKIQVTNVTYYAKNDQGVYSALTGNYSESEHKYSGDVPNFTNTYESTTTHYTPVANKLLLGAVDSRTGNRKVLELGDNLYSFEIVELNAADWSEKGVASIGANAANDLPGTEKGAVVFTPISYSHRTVNQNPHTHYYEIREVAGSLSGVTYDTTKYYMAVEVYDDGAGKLYVLNAKYYAGTDAEAAFKNSSPVYTETFYEYNESAAEKLTNKMVDGKPVVGANETPVTFTNHYGPGYVNINLELGKVVQLVNTNEYDMQDGQFDFTVRMTNGTEVGNGTFVTSGSNKDDGDSNILKDKIVFGSITKTKEEVPDFLDLVYEIMEDVPSDAAVKGITVDTKPIYAHVRVVNDGYGNLSYTVVYREGKESNSAEITDAAFTNIYTAKPVDFYIVAHKHLTGKQLADKEFEFELYQVENSAETKIATTQNNAAGEVVFQMHYDKPGEYVYYLKEAGKGPGAVDGEYGFDNHYYKITVVVADDTEGNLYVQSADKVRLENTSTFSLRAPGLTYVAGMDFYNTFKPNGISINLNVVIGAEKVVVDAEGNIRPDLTAGFEFRVLDIRNKPAFTDAQGNEVYAKSNADGEIVLPNFNFEVAGEYHYWIFEKDAAKPFEEDSAIYEIHILVRQNTSTSELEVNDSEGHFWVPSGGLYIIPSEVMTFVYNGVSAQAEGDPTAQSDEDPVVFVNQYKPDPETVTITAEKILTGRDMKAGEFTFHLTENVNGVDLIRAEATNDADGTVKFTLTYVTDGEHTYSIHEHAPADEHKAGGVTYDTKNYGSIKVTVKEENGELKVTQGLSINSGVTIKNAYKAKPVTAVVEAKKTITGGLALKADAFIFQLKDEDGNVVTTAKNDAEGKIKFEIPFEHKDLNGQTSATFGYTIHEVKGDIPGIVYDETEYKVFVTVTDDLNGNLHYSVSYEIGMAPTFTNVYETDDALVTIKATKKLTGKNLAGEDFEFQLKDEAGNVVKTAKNDAQGNITFQLTLDEVKDYTFTIVEVAHADNHYSHDDSEYKVTVKVKDNGLGQLVAEEPVYEKTPVFENTYSPDAIYVTVEASKLLSGGKTLKGNDFEFQLLVKDEVVDTAKNGADGKIKFEIPYEFKDLGGEAEKTFTYTMVEKAGNDPDHYNYDSNKYTVTVKLVNDNGVLKAAVTYGTEGGKAPVFQNTWKPEKIGITLTGSKTLTGRDMKAGEFKFQVHDTTGTLVATGTNDAKGKITFTPVGIVTKGTYLLTVSEVKGSAEYVTYDKTTFQVKVVVENVDGVLVPAVTYLDGDIAFENSYDEPNNPETGDNSPIYWMVGLLAISGLAIVLLIALRPKKKGGKYAK